MAAHRESNTVNSFVLLRVHFLMGRKEVSKTIIPVNNKLDLRAVTCFQLFLTIIYIYLSIMGLQ